MKKILLITTGGTIASGQTGEGLAPVLQGGDFPFLHELLSPSFELKVRNLFQLDSSNIQPEEWQCIARTVAEEYQNFDGIVLTHGTDTLAYTAAALSFMLQNLPIPLVLTGSQLPLTHLLTDGVENLRCAFAMAASGKPGVFVAFHRKVILGTRAVKVRTFDMDAFESINYPYIATVNAAGLVMNESALPKVTGSFRLEDRICSRVFLLKLIPGLDPAIFDMLLKMDFRGIVVEAFGAGGMNFLRRDLVSKLKMMVKAGVAVIVCSQCLYERSDFSIYQTGRKALETGVLEAHDMTTEAAVTKLMWVLGQTSDSKEIQKLCGEDLSGEISPAAAHT